MLFTQYRPYVHLSVHMYTYWRFMNLKKFVLKATFFRLVLKQRSKVTKLQCVKSVQIRSFSGPYFPVFRPEKDLETFHAVLSSCIYIYPVLGIAPDFIQNISYHMLLNSSEKISKLCKNRNN